MSRSLASFDPFQPLHITLHRPVAYPGRRISPPARALLAYFLHRAQSSPLPLAFDSAVHVSLLAGQKFHECRHALLELESHGLLDIDEPGGEA